MKCITILAVICLAASGLAAKDYPAERPAPEKSIQYFPEENRTVVRLFSILKQPLFDGEEALVKDGVTNVDMTLWYHCPAQQTVCKTPAHSGSKQNYIGLTIGLYSTFRKDFLLSPTDTEVHFSSSGTTILLSDSFTWDGDRSEGGDNLNQHFERLNTILPIDELKSILAKQDVRIHIGPYWCAIDSVALKAMRAFLSQVSSAQSHGYK